MVRLNAVLHKELTTRGRRGRATAVLTLYVAVLAAVAVVLLYGQDIPQDYATSARLGQSLFAALTGLQMALIIFITPASLADAISGERQRQTLEALLATRLSSPSIILGKLAAGLSFDVLLILASVPLFSMVFLFGGVSPDQLVSMFVVFLATTLVIGAMSLFISTMFRRSGAAMIISMLCTLGLTAGLALVNGYLLNTTTIGTSPVQDIPFSAYLDPLLGYVAALPDFSTTGLSYATGGLLHLSLWQDQVIVDVLLSILFVLGSVSLLRPRWPAQTSRLDQPQ